MTRLSSRMGNEANCRPSDVPPSVPFGLIGLSCVLVAFSDMHVDAGLG
ncbi:hypothetical protein AG1IA_06224 [Rhizoctonia solani AG-1 IA]|uniref:Uncharacterized protein n=1 Tax=Thanatephorus cucumeris (strain AG1-IA) TaxID=983506 RepID=L8WSN9_THACA|nr:hypothetical protein AG1IA_06224 [Rhizoctonia solani AG-1 IA]